MTTKKERPGVKKKSKHSKLIKTKASKIKKVKVKGHQRPESGLKQLEEMLKIKRTNQLA